MFVYVYYVQVVGLLFVKTVLLNCKNKTAYCEGNRKIITTTESYALYTVILKATCEVINWIRLMQSQISED